MPEERGQLLVKCKELAWKRERLVERGVLYRLTYPPGGGSEIFQLVLPQRLQEDVLRNIHDGHGHQGRERTLNSLL